VRAEQPGHLGELGVAADEAGQLGTQVGVRRGFGGLGEELQVQRREFGRRVCAELVGQALPGLLVDLQGSTAPPGRVQGAHQPGGQRLAQRVRHDQLLEQRQHDQQRAQPGPADLERLARAGPDLQRTEHRHLHALNSA